MSAASLEIVISAIDDTTKAFRSVTDSIAGLEAGAKRIKDTGKAIGDFGKKMTLGVSAPLAAIGVAALKTSTDLNTSLANVQALGVAADTIKSLRSTVKDMAVEYGRSSVEISDGLYQVISALGESKDNVAQLDQVMNTAVAGAATATESLELLALVTKGYGDTSSTAMGQVSDFALATVKLGQTSFSELSASMGSVVPLANELGVEMQEMFAVMATATGVTGNTSAVSTQFRGVLQSLLAPTENMAALYEKMGFASGHAAIETLGLGGTIAAITAAAEESGQSLQSYIGSIEGQTIAMFLAGAGAEKFKANNDALGASAGSTGSAFKAQTEGINEAGFAAAQARESMRNLSDTLGTIMGPSLLSASEGLTRVAAAMSRFAEANPAIASFAVSVGAIAVVVGPALIAIGAITSAVGTMIPVFGAVAGFVAAAAATIAGAISLPIVAAIALGAAVATAAALIIKHWSSIKAAFASTASAIIGIISSMGSSIVSTLSGIASQMFSAGSRIVGRIADGIRSGIGKVRDAAGAVAGAVAGMFPGSPVDYGDLTVLNGQRNTGFAIAEMIASGINRGNSLVSSAAGNLAGGAASSLPMPTSGGGSMVNNINVTVNGGTNPEATAKATASELRGLFAELFREQQQEQARVSYG